jgi:hypothetical protein
MNHIAEQSRRGFLAALAGTGIGVAAVSGLAHADGSTAAGDPDAAGSSQGFSTEAAFDTEAYPTPTPGTSYKFLVGAEFQPQISTYTYDKGQGQLSTTAFGIFYRPLSDLPTGAVITEITTQIVKVATGQDTSFFLYRFSSGAIELVANASSTGFATSTTEQPITIPVSTTPQWIIDNSFTNTHWLVATLNANARLNSVRIGYIDPTPPAFHAIPPKRVYDSRFIAPLGLLATGASRVISVANGYPNGSGTIDVADVVPVGAKAVAYNITVVDTVNSGFLSVNPGDATAAGGSSINWFGSGQILANGLVVTLDNNRQMKVFCGGGGATDLLVDILGYYR